MKTTLLALVSSTLLLLPALASADEVCGAGTRGFALRTSPDLHSDRGGVVTNGSAVKTLSRSADKSWVRVSSNGKTGWMPRGKVCRDPIKPAPGGKTVAPYNGICKGRRGFGMRFHPIDKRMKFHDGQDYPGANGTRLSSASSGTVVHAGRLRGFGYAVVVRRDNPDGSSDLFLYGHMCCGHQKNLTKSSILVKKGDTVFAGQPIGKVGDTGHSKGAHLHLLTRHVPKGAAAGYKDPSSKMFFSHKYAIDPNRLLKVRSCGAKAASSTKSHKWYRP